MGCPTRINLPPRYLHQVRQSRAESKEPIVQATTTSKVRFKLKANKVRRLPQTPRTKTDTWYGRDDYARFMLDWELDIKKHIEKQQMPSSSYLTKWLTSTVEQNQPKEIPSLEELQMIQQCQPPVDRNALVQSILLHQAHCRLKGFQDPDGYSVISKSLSKGDRKMAWQLAAVNAYEVQKMLDESAPSRAYLKSDEPSPTAMLFLEYYIDAVHPYLSQPLVLMSKLLLCDCE